MDYEEKYKQALEIARYYHNRDNIQFLEQIFPELKKSEDERIRKGLIKGLSAMRDIHKHQTFSDDAINIEDAIAWLEKQGEKKSIISDDALREGIAHFGITQYQIDNWLKKYVDVEKQDSQILANSEKTCKDEQNPAWSEDDEKYIANIIAVLEGWDREHLSSITSVIPKCIDWLNKKMFDYRGLIEKGLAIEVPENMYNTKTEQL